MNKTPISRYLTKVIDSHLSERTLSYHMDERPKEYTITPGVPQGSMLEILVVSKDVTLIDFADYLIVVVVTKPLEDGGRLGRQLWEKGYD